MFEKSIFYCIQFQLVVALLFLVINPAVSRFLSYTRTRLGKYKMALYHLKLHEVYSFCPHQSDNT